MSTTTVKFDERTSAILEELKEHFHAASKAEVLRKAIALLDVVSEADENEKEIIIRPKNRRSREPEQRLLFR